MGSAGGANYLRTHASNREAIGNARAEANFSSSRSLMRWRFLVLLRRWAKDVQFANRFHSHVQFINIILSIFTAVQQQQGAKDNAAINSTVYHIAICCLFAEGYADLTLMQPQSAPPKKAGTSPPPVVFHMR